MVTNVTSLTSNGLKDWLIQRFTALYFMVYSIGMLAYLLFGSPLNYQQWYTLFHSVWFQAVTIIALLTLSLHIWIGVWTVITDYIKSTAVRLIVQFLVVIWLLWQFVWGLLIVWGR